MKKIITIISIILITFGGSACVKLTTYEGTDFKTKRLQTKVTRIVLHADFIKATDDNLRLQAPFIQALEKALQSKNKGFEIIVKKKGEKLPDFRDNKGVILIAGDVWSRRTERKGDTVQVKRLSKNTKTSRRSWDVIENINWEKESLLAYTNLYFIEFSSSPKLLNSSITVSSREIEHIAGNQGTKRDSSRDRFEIFDPDSETKSFFSSKSTAKRIATGYKAVSWNSSVQILAELSAAKHINGIF